MKNKDNQWAFRQRPSRPPLSEEEAEYNRIMLERLLKVGFEFEFNLPQQNGTCERENAFCKCVSVFEPKNKIPETKKCFEQCRHWDPNYPEDGNCSIAKEHGCKSIFCAHFSSPCPTCNLYDRGCDSCQHLFDRRKAPEAVRERLTSDLKPTNFVGKFGKKGIYKVIKDGSLTGDGGVEVVTVGRRVQFWPLYNMCKEILDRCKAEGAFLNERCSMHNHLLASYLKPDLRGDEGAKYLRGDINEMEQPVPEIVLANFHQLFRRYQNAFVWMSAAGSNKENITRWEKFRKSVLKFSAVRKNMQVIQNEMNGGGGRTSRYSSMNYKPTEFTPDGRQIDKLHVEGRYSDGLYSPAAAVAHACLLYGLMLKAVDISTHGIIEVGDKQFVDEQLEIYNALCNNDGDYGGPRVSHTGDLDPYIPKLRELSHELISLVKSSIADLGPTHEILRSLAEKPIAYRLIEGQTWDEIEQDLMPVYEKPKPVVRELKRIIDLSSINDCESEEEWVNVVAEHLANRRGFEGDPDEVQAIASEISDLISKRKKNGRLRWSPGVGSFIAS